jgi:Kef-type K+ transport system membrane component KefB
MSRLVPMPLDLFTETTVVLVLAAAVSAVGACLRQPLIVAYIITGVLLGPTGLNWVQAEDIMDLLAQMGIALLLFVVGLKLDPRLIRAVGSVVLVLGLFQVAITAALGFGLALWLDLAAVTALYIGLGLAFSSTVVIVKMLSDSLEIDALHGRIALGILIVQDLIVVIAMIVVNAVSRADDNALLRDLLLVPFKGAAFLTAVALTMRYLLSHLLRAFARSSELLMLIAVAWAVALAAVGHALGFSHEVGAFAAGVALAATPYHDAIGARLSALRDFLLLFFFIDLGAHVDLGDLEPILIPALALSAFALLVKPLIVVSLLGIAGYHRRTAGLTALTMGQISEFSLILAAMGLKIEHLDSSIVSLMTLTALTTIMISGYVIGYIHPIYERLSPWLQIFERRSPKRESALSTDPITPAEVIVLGLGRFGKNIALAFQTRGLTVLALDFDPQLIRTSHELGIPTRYGDAADADMLATLPLAETRWVVCSIRETHINLALLHTLKQLRYRGRIIVSAHHADAEQQLQAAGAHLVLRPYADAAEQAVDLITGHDYRRLRANDELPAP